MIISELRVYDFRQFKSVDDAPGLKITFHKGLNALIGENDSGKTAVIDALKLVLLTQSNEYIRPSDEDFYKPVGEDACSEFKIDCTISDFTQNEAKNFIEYLSFNQTENGIEYTLELHYRAWKEGHKIYQELRVGDIDYVFIDEYQDCNNLQRQAIDVIFDPQKCAVFKIGDSDQAIYNSAEDTTPDWMPQPDFLPIVTSCRFNQEIANVICKLKKGEKNIVTLAGATGVKPVLLVFSPENIDRVIGGFISALDRHELYDNNGIYKAIGAVKREDLSGLKIGSYWTEFDGSANKKNEYSYWVLVDEIVQYLLEGKLYKAEQSVRRLLCRVFHYISIKHPVSGKDYTIVAMKNALDEKYRGQYRQWIYEMSRIQTIDRHSVDQLLRQKINELLRIGNPSLTDIFTVLPAFFLEESTSVNHADIAEKNVLIDPIRGRRIIFDTIHSVKGETHDATLYLETDRQGASDLNRILPYFGVGRCGSSSLYDSSRKLAYVGMSRPKKLLCVAMQAETYEKSKGIFDADWEVVDLRG